MSRNILSQVSKTFAILSVLCLIGSSTAAASTPNQPPSGSADGSDGTTLVGTGWTDVRTLKIIGKISPSNSVLAPVQVSEPLLPSPAPESTELSTQTNEVACGGRLDYYRMIDWNGNTFCYANPGSAYVWKTQIQYLCPGNNNGYVYYNFNGGAWATLYQSTVRYKTGNWNECFMFDGATAYVDRVFLFS